jgi:pimeloyl-ACP methyl ester carboxylesterase
MVWRRRAPEKILNDFIHRQSFVDQRWAGSTNLALGAWLRPRGGRTDWHRIASRLDYGPRLGSIRIPTLILCGRHDPQYAPACSEELAAGIRDSRVAWFERSGHFPFIEEADAFWPLVGNFLGAASGRPASPSIFVTHDRSACWERA